MAGTRQLGEAQPLGLRLFLEGIEVPVAAATVDINEGAAAVAQIEIVALDSAFDLKPRTVVHLFFFDGDAWKYAPGGDLGSYYKLLFCGELFSYTFQKSGAGSRSFVLNCIDFSNYWDTSYIFQVNNADTLLDVPQIQPFITGSDVIANTIVGNMGQLIDMMRQQSKLPQTIPPVEVSSFVSSLMGFLEMLGGVSVLDDDPTVAAGSTEKVAQRNSLHGGMNAWSTLTERRVRLLDQIAVDSGKTAEALFTQETFIKFLKGQSDLSSSVLSFRDILNLLMGHIYYTSFPNPCGRLLKGTNVNVTPLTPGTQAGSGGGSGYTPPRPYVPPSSLTINPAFLPIRNGQKMTLAELEIERALFQAPEAPEPSVVFLEPEPEPEEAPPSWSLRFETPVVPGISVVPEPEPPKYRPKYETGWAYEQLSANYSFDDIIRYKQSGSWGAAQRSEGLAVYNYLRDLCLFIIEPLREFFAKKNVTVEISSGFRSRAKNESLRPRSSPTSEHMKGTAVDLTFGSMDPWEAYKIIRLDWLPAQPAGETGLVGQLIFEKMGDGSGWVHIALGTLWGGFSYMPMVGITSGTGLVKINVRSFKNIARDTPRPTE